MQAPLATETQCLALADLSVVIEASVATLATVTQLWRDSFFFHQAPIPTADDLPIYLRIHGPDKLEPPLVNDPAVYHAGDLTVHKTATGFLLRCSESWLAVAVTDRLAWGHIAADFAQTRPQDQRDLFLLLILMFAHREGYYGLHANALSDGVRDYLVIGPSGSGKSTLTVQLLELGWRCGGDDIVLLAPQSAEPTHRTVLALRRDFALAEETIRHAPALAQHVASLLSATEHEDGEKQIVSAAVVAPTALQQAFQPSVLLFARIIDTDKSRLTALPPAEALVALAQQSAGLMTDRGIAAQQLHALTQLVESTVTYQLDLGRDLFTHPTEVAAYLQALK